MDDKLIGFVTTEYRIGKWKIAPIDILLLCATLVFGILLRSKVWKVDAIHDTDIAVTGMYQQTMLAVSIIADAAVSVICGVFVYSLTGSRIRAFITPAIIFLSPAMAIGSAMAKSGDGVFLSLMLMAVLLFSKRKYILSAVSFILSLAAYFTIIRFSPWYEEIYKAGRLLSYDFPNLYQIIGADAFVDEYTKAGYALTAAVVTGLGIWAYNALYKGPKEKESPSGFEKKVVMAALVFSWAITYIMPGMDERSGMISLCLVLIFVIARPRYYYIAISEEIVMFLPWAAFFRGESFFPLSAAAMIQLFIIMVFSFNILPDEDFYQHGESKQQG